MLHCQSLTEGWEGHRTEHRDQYIISYKLNLTWIDLEGVRDRLRPVAEYAVNPSDQYRRGWQGGVGGRRAVLSEGCLFRGGKRREEFLWWRTVNMAKERWCSEGEETEVVLVYYLQSGGCPLLPSIAFKRFHHQSISIIVNLFGHSQFYALILCSSNVVCVCVSLTASKL